MSCWLYRRRQDQCFERRGRLRAIGGVLRRQIAGDVRQFREAAGVVFTRFGRGRSSRARSPRGSFRRLSCLPDCKTGRRLDMSWIGGRLLLLLLLLLLLVLLPPLIDAGMNRHIRRTYFAIAVLSP